MAIAKELRQDFNNKATDLKVYLDDLKKENNVYRAQGKKNPKLEPYFQIGLSVNTIKIINTYLLLNDMFMGIAQMRHEDSLNSARKELYNSISELEKVVGWEFEGGLSENKEKLEKITQFTATQRLNFIKGLRMCLEKIIEGFGSGSKWKWSFPELYFRIAVLAKNLMDWRQFEKGRGDLSDQDYYIRKEHFNLIIELSNLAAQEYRAKFDLSTQDINDLRRSIALLEMNRKIFQITGETDDLEKTKTLIESLEYKVEQIEAEKEKKKKKK